MNKNEYKNILHKIASENVPQKPTIYQKRMEKIKSCGQSATLLELSYLDKKGVKTKRFVEPYKLTGDDFWGYDIQKDSIRRFKTKNIKGVKVTSKPFMARWQIEV